jgi:diguanylate cyclase (GGDEF)-like protein
MARKGSTTHATGRTILLVDDSEDVLEANRSLLEREGHTVLTALSGQAGLEILRTRDVELLVVDYFMPVMTGEDVVAELRTFNRSIQVILSTGYASERPPREMLARLDIQGYCDKSEGPDNLLLWVDVGLKMASQVRTLEMSRQGLRYILDVTPDLHRIQPLGDLLQGILFQISGLLGAVNSFVAIPGRSPATTTNAHDSSTDSFLAMMEDERELVVQAAIGRFTHEHSLEGQLRDAAFEDIRKALKTGEITRDHSTLSVPLRIGSSNLGVIYLDQVPPLSPDNQEMLRIFANQAAVAVQNAQLYQAAALDPLTGVYTRKFWQQLALRELRTCFRFRHPISVVVLDMDGFKQINDQHGHLAGDKALEAVGRSLRSHMRASDAAGRFGGDEFVLLLPRTDHEGSIIVCRRILEELDRQGWTEPDGSPIQLRATLGSATLPPHTYDVSTLPRPVPNEWFQGVMRGIFEHADRGVYRGKAQGGHVHTADDAFNWPEPPPSSSDPDDPDSTFFLPR